MIWHVRPRHIHRATRELSRSRESTRATRRHFIIIPGILTTKGLQLWCSLQDGNLRRLIRYRVGFALLFKYIFVLPLGKLAS